MATYECSKCGMSVNATCGKCNAPLVDDTIDVDGAKVIRRELKQSSFKRQFELGELLDGENIKANFKDGILSVSVPKLEPEKPKKHTVKIA